MCIRLDPLQLKLGSQTKKASFKKSLTRESLRYLLEKLPWAPRGQAAGGKKAVALGRWIHERVFWVSAARVIQGLAQLVCTFISVLDLDDLYHVSWLRFSDLTLLLLESFFLLSNVLFRLRKIEEAHHYPDSVPSCADGKDIPFFLRLHVALCTPQIRNGFYTLLLMASSDWSMCQLS